MSAIRIPTTFRGESRGAHPQNNLWLGHRIHKLYEDNNSKVRIGVTPWIGMFFFFIGIVILAYIVSNIPKS